MSGTRPPPGSAIPPLGAERFYVPAPEGDIPAPVERDRVLILSAGAGTGHLRAAEALHEASLREFPDLDVRHVDVLELAFRWVRAGYGDGFELLAARAPFLWRGLYRWTDGPDPGDSRWWSAAERLLFREYRRLLRSPEWSLCLCTHFLPLQLAGRHAGRLPFHLVVTDYALHRYWVQPTADRYYVGTETLARELRARTSAPVRATGIPVARAFSSPPAAAEARRELGLDPGRPVVLLVAGGMGLRMEERVEAALAARLSEVQILAVCGRNEEARAGLEPRAGPNLRVLGFVDHMERAIAAADLVVTKPGGLTIAEALAVGRPLLLTRPIPGHEEENVRALVSEGAAASAPGDRELGEVLAALFRTPGRLAEMSAAARRLGRPDAAQEIVRDSYQAARLSAAA